MIELIHTLTNPPDYQIMMNSIKLLTENILDSEKFLKKIFVNFAYDKILKDKNMVINTILSKFSKEDAEKIYEKDENFSIGK
jgi:hypothetical protein